MMVEMTSIFNVCLLVHVCLCTVHDSTGSLNIWVNKQTLLWVLQVMLKTVRNMVWSYYLICIFKSAVHV